AGKAESRSRSTDPQVADRYLRRATVGGVLLLRARLPLGRGPSRGGGDGEEEGAPPPGFGLYTDGASVGIDDSARNHEAESGPVEVSPLPLPERVEEVWQALFGNARSGIGNGEAHPSLDRLHENSNRPPCRCELDRIPDQVRQHLQESVAI